MIFTAATFNNRSSVPEYLHVFDVPHQDVLALTETWDPRLGFPSSFWSSSSGTYQSLGRHRNGGGVSLVSGLPLRPVATVTERFVQAVAARFHDILIIAVYIAPQQNVATLTASLSRLSSFLRGKVLSLVVFDARSTKWVLRSSVHGPQLLRWVQRLNSRVAAPHVPTSAGCSVVNLALVKSVSASAAKVYSEWWDTDQKLVSLCFPIKQPFLFKWVPGLCSASRISSALRQLTIVARSRNLPLPWPSTRSLMDSKTWLMGS